MRKKWIYFPIAVAGVALAAFSGTLYTLFHADCPTTPLEITPRTDNFVFDPAELAGKEKLVILVPGALNPIDIFSSAQTLKSRGFGTISYRLPGLDGRPLDRVVSIAGIADEVVEFAKRFSEKEISVVGFSIGAQVALEAAAKSKGRISKVVILSGSVGFPSTFGTGFRAISWVVRRAWAVGTINLASVWKDFYRVLLFGEAGVTDSELSRRSDEIIAARRNKIVVPTRALVCSHMRDITFRTAVEPTSVGDTAALFVHGQWDIVSPVDGIVAYARQFRASHVVILERQGHQIFLTDPALFDRIGEFLSK